MKGGSFIFRAKFFHHLGLVAFAAPRMIPGLSCPWPAEELANPFFWYLFGTILTAEMAVSCRSFLTNCIMVLN